MNSFVIALLVAGRSAGRQFETLDQAKLESVVDVSVSGNGYWYAYTMTGVAGDKGALAATSEVVVKQSDNSPIQDTSTTFAGFSSPKFSPDGSRLAMVGNATIVIAAPVPGAKRWAVSDVLDLSASNGSLAAFTWAPDGTQIAFSVTPPAPPQSMVDREVTTDVIINVITGTPSAPANQLCTVPIGSDGIAAGAVSCLAGIEGSVGFGGWYISCWPYDSQFTFSPSGQAIAYTYTDTTLSNEWAGTGVALHILGSNTSTSISYNTSFQPAFNNDGSMLAFVKADDGDYKWAQTWHFCVLDIETMAERCEAKGTHDQMPTLVGWNGDVLVYTEQVSVEMKLFAIPVTPEFGSFYEIAVDYPAPFAKTGPGVIGGGFRATSRVTLSKKIGEGAMLGFTYEDPTNPQQAFVGAFPAKREGATVVATQISALNRNASTFNFDNVQVINWKSDDGLMVEGLLTLPKGAPSRRYPLVTFTHCGPAMSVMATFTGYGSVCARFPLSILTNLGYAVLQPNYRGSTGYGAEYRRADKGDWGGNDYNDVMSGIRHLIDTGVVDEARVSHIGWSYGGYMSALAMGTSKTTHNVTLQAIVTGGTLTDLISHTGTTDISKIIHSWAGGYYWSSEERLNMMMDHSGMYHIQNASTPTLMFHGIDDPRMPISQSFQLHYALQQRGIPVRFLTFPGSGHIPSNPNQIIRVWDETIAWLTQYNPK